MHGGHTDAPCARHAFLSTERGGGGGGGGDALKAQERLRRSQSVWRVLPPLKKGFNTENMAYYAGA